MRLTSKGQVTIPRRSGTASAFCLTRGRVRHRWTTACRIRKKVGSKGRGQRLRRSDASRTGQAEDDDRRVDGPDSRRRLMTTLVDSNVVIDFLHPDE